MASKFEEKVAASMNKYSGTIKSSGSTPSWSGSKQVSSATPTIAGTPGVNTAYGTSSSQNKQTPKPYTPPKTTGNVPTPPIANAATGGNAPSTGYGGASYGSSGAANKAISANESALKNNAGFKDSEIGRTLAVIDARKAQGLDTSAQEKYLNVNLGYTGGKRETSLSPTPPMPNMPASFTPDYSSTPSIPVFTPSIPSMDWDAIQKYADQQLAADLLKQKTAADSAIAKGQLTADQQTASLRQAAERLRGDITEQRGIENVENARRLSPFSGRSDYAQGMIERERGKTDRQLTENQQMQEANIQANLAQLRNQIDAGYLALEQAAPAERERIIQQLRDSERQYSLQEAQLEIDRNLANSQLKNTDFGQQLASWEANRGAYEFDKNFGLQEGQLTGNYNGQKTAAQQQQEWENRFNYGQAIGQFGNGQKTLEMQRFEEDRKRYGEEWAYQKARDQIEDERYKAEFDEDVKWRGLNYALDKAMQNAQISNMRADNARQAANQSSGGSSGGTTKVNYEADPGFAQEIAWINANPAGAYEEIQKSAQDLIAQYTYDGYLALLKAATPKG